MRSSSYSAESFSATSFSAASLTSTDLPTRSNTSADFATAFLTPDERRALLEDIGAIALVLGRSLYSVSPDSPAGLTSETSFPASPARCRRSEAISSPLERLHLLVALWMDLEAPLQVLLRQPDSRTCSATRPMPLARSQGTARMADRVARTPRAALAWQHLLSERADSTLLNSTRAHAIPSQTPNIPLNTDFTNTNLTSTNLTNTSPIPGPASISSLSLSGRPDQTPVDARFIRLTYDTWPNRLVVTLLTHIAQEAHALGQIAKFCDAQNEALQADWLARAARRLRRLPALGNCPVLSDAEQTQTAAGETMLRSAPAYHVVYQVWRTLHHPLDFDWTRHPLLTLPALEPWRLYEIWCYLQVAAALLRAGGQLSDGGSLLRCTPRGLQLTLTTGRLSRLQFKETGSRAAEMVSLYYQPLFVSANQRHDSGGCKYKSHEHKSHEDISHEHKSHEDGSSESEMRENEGAKSDKEAEFAFCSRSHAMQPDMALHTNGRLILLDPKYKRFTRAEEVQEDIDKMHTYCDAIVSDADAIILSRSDVTVRSANPAREVAAVSAAWCLFAGSPSHVAYDPVSYDPDAADVCQGANRLDAATASPDPAPAASIYAYPTASLLRPYGSANVGAFQLRPGQPDINIRLSAFLAALRDAV